MITQRRRSQLRAVASLFGLAGGLACFAAPPPPAAERPSAAPPAAAAIKPAAASAENRCGAVRRAPRTWVGFAEGGTLDDMVPAAQAAAAVVRALDSAICAVSRGQAVPVLAAHSSRLQSLAADGGGLEVTKVLWQDVGLSWAEVEIHAARAPSRGGWTARMVRDGERWNVATFAQQN